MGLFFIWLGIAALLLFLFCLRLWIKNRRTARFQARLTILFLLFILTPAIPLVFLTATLLTQSAQLLFLPGIGEALETSLETVRIQLEEGGYRFLDSHPDAETWSPTLLESHKIACAGIAEWDGKTLDGLCNVRTTNCVIPAEWQPDQRLIQRALDSNRSAQLVQISGRQWLSLAEHRADSTFAVLIMDVPESVIAAKNQISEAITVYNTMSLIKESIIRKNLVWAIAILLLVILASLAIVAARNLSRDVSEPVRDLVSGMERAASGDLSAPVTTTAKGEFRFLVDTFNRMLTDLASAGEKLLEAERVSARQEVARRISHEIKNSLTPISISLRNLRKIEGEKEPDPRRIKQLDALEEEFQSLKNMAAEFSEFTRMPQPEKTWIKLNDVILSTARFLEATAENIRIKTILSENLPEIEADREQIKRMIGNLLKNAIEASPARSAVTLTTEKSADGKAIVIEIRDEGQGMDEATLTRAFEPYFTTKAKGTGLGLAIVRKIVDEHQGTLQIESQKGKGTQVVIQFPITEKMG